MWIFEVFGSGIVVEGSRGGFVSGEGMTVLLVELYLMRRRD